MMTLWVQPAEPGGGAEVNVSVEKTAKVKEVTWFCVI